MGSTVSIDKHVSNLDELLEFAPGYFAGLQFENKIPEGLTQHLKIWKFYEDHKKVDMIKTLPIPLVSLQNSGFLFSSEEAYLILLIYKTEFEGIPLIVMQRIDKCELVNFPHSLCGVVESVSNLTPRGLLSTFSSTNESVAEPSPVMEGSSKFVENLESFIISRRQDKDTKYKYMLFLWNGKNSSNLVKALAITKGYELDTLIHSAKDPLLHILFSGGVIRHKKLQRGSVLLFGDMVSAAPSDEPKLTGIKKARETVYLLQWWLPQQVGKATSETEKKNALKYPRFTHTVLAAASKGKDYFARFDDLEDGDEEISDDRKVVLAEDTIVDENAGRGRVKTVPEKEENKKEPAKPPAKREMPKLTFAMHMQKQSPSEREDIKEAKRPDPAEDKGDEEAKLSKDDDPVQPLQAPVQIEQVPQKKGLALPVGVLKTREDEAQELKRIPQAKWDPANARDTNIREIGNEMFTNQCTEIIKDFLYMGSDQVAQNKELLASRKITHIVNCAADYSDNYFPTEFKYKSYYLKDTVQENIECCFYDTIDFIKSAQSSGGRVFVHCIQGISRSATLCIAYLIFELKMTHQAAFALLQKERPIANPNMIFNVQLIWWYMRLYQDYSALPVSPRVYAISSHQREQPSFIVARLVTREI